MKKVLIEFKMPINSRHYDIYYKAVPKIFTKFYIKRLHRKRCWDIKIIDDKKDGIYNHIPRID